jgi:hypothetical protein
MENQTGIQKIQPCECVIELQWNKGYQFLFFLFRFFGLILFGIHVELSEERKREREKEW